MLGDYGLGVVAEYEPAHTRIDGFARLRALERTVASLELQEKQLQANIKSTPANPNASDDLRALQATLTNRKLQLEDKLRFKEYYIRVSDHFERVLEANAREIPTPDVSDPASQHAAIKLLGSHKIAIGRARVCWR